jgi:predicted O-linked N-acetylglucosamine transferase (SPINDLY family)
MGGPVVTLIGKTVAGRSGWSLLCNLDLPELAAKTPEEYVAIASGLANDVSRLQKLRTGLRERIRTSPLMDGKRFAQNVEQAFREIWRQWCRRQA